MGVQRAYGYTKAAIEYTLNGFLREDVQLDTCIYMHERTGDATLHAATVSKSCHWAKCISPTGEKREAIIIVKIIFNPCFGMGEQQKL